MQRSLIKLLKRGYGNWQPKIPKHKIIIDKTTYRSPHPIWNMQDAEKVEITHTEPKGIRDKLAYSSMKLLRKSFDFLTGYKPGKMTESKYLTRVIFLETVAGVPGFVGAMVRHLNSLRGLRKDGGWIHHLLEEAENERMHLLTFLNLKQPGILMRLAILWTQFAFIFGYGLTYVLSPTMAHRFVGYLEEEAVKTYTNLIKEIDDGMLPLWETHPAPKEAIKYWGLSEDAKIRDVFVAVRADEVQHREFNHHFADIPKDVPIEGHKFVTNDEIIRWDEEKYQQKKEEERKAAAAAGATGTTAGTNATTAANNPKNLEIDLDNVNVKNSI